MNEEPLFVNSSMSATAYRCFENISPEDKIKFVKKFKDQCNDGWLTTHSFRELVLGTYLCSSNLHAQYEYRVDSLTPDWSIIGQDQQLCGVVEMVNFHAPQETENCYWKDISTSGR